MAKRIQQLPLTATNKNYLNEKNNHFLIGGAPEGFDSLLISDLAKDHSNVLVIARDDVSMFRNLEALS